jgi:hypothetical protein
LIVGMSALSSSVPFASGAKTEQKIAIPPARPSREACKAMRETNSARKPQSGLGAARQAEDHGINPAIVRNRTGP